MKDEQLLTKKCMDIEYAYHFLLLVCNLRAEIASIIGDVMLHSTTPQHYLIYWTRKHKLPYKMDVVFKNAQDYSAHTWPDEKSRCNYNTLHISEQSTKFSVGIFEYNTLITNDIHIYYSGIRVEILYNGCDFLGNRQFWKYTVRKSETAKIINRIKLICKDFLANY